MSLIILSDDNSNSNELPEISFPSSQHSRNSLDSDAIFDQVSKYTTSLSGCERGLTKPLDSGIFSGCSTAHLGRSHSGASTKYDCRGSSSSLSQGKRKSNVSDNAIEKSAKLLGQSKKKRRLAVEKSLRCEAVEKTKRIKPGVCKNYVRVEIHPNLGAMWYMINVLEELDTIGAEVLLKEDQDPDLLLWSCKSTHGDTGQSVRRASHCVYVCEASRVAGLVAAHGLASHARAKQPQRTRLTVALFGVKDYFKSCNRKNHNGEKITEIELELAITDMIVWADCDAIMVNTPSELGLFIKQFTKAIADTPYKIASRVFDEQANFYTKGCNKNCVAVDKDGNGLRRLWQQMIAVLPKSTLGHARALCNKYNSPLALYQALKSPNSVNKIADVSINTIAVPASKSRRLGPEFARKLNILFTAEDGNTLLD